MLKKTLLLCVAGMLLSACQNLTVTPSPDSYAPFQCNLHWLERCTLGVNEAAFERWQSQGSDKWLDGQLKTTHPLPPEIQQRVDALDISQQSLQRILAHASDLKAAIDAAQTDEAREAARKSQREYENGIVQDAMRRNLWRAVYSQDSLRERMTWFWFNHFNVFSGKANLRYLIPDYEENAIRPHALGKFSELVMATLKHPAMLVYLDNAQNAAGKINENYARELMELHTLGVNAGYTQQDVQELARILTGVGVNFSEKPKPAAKLTGYILDGAFEFNPRRHDTGDKVLLGHKFHGAGFNGFNEVEQAVKLLCRQSATAKHISTQMAAYFLGKEPAAPLVNAMAATFQKSDGDIAATLKVLLTSQVLQQNAGSFKDPYRYVVAALRQGYEGRIISNMKPAMNWLNQMGEPLYGKLTPDGYSMLGEAWSSEGQMVKRFEIARAIGSGGAGLFDSDGKSSSSGAGFPGFQSRFFYRAIEPQISANTRDVLNLAGSQQEWNLLWLSSPEMMYD
jgi:uncharacterized protein (DUF1800 family)